MTVSKGYILSIISCRCSVASWNGTLISTKFHTRSGAILLSSATPSLPVIRSGVSKTFCFPEAAAARGLSNATFSKSIGSLIGRCLFASAARQMQSKPPENNMATRAIE